MKRVIASSLLLIIASVIALQGGGITQGAYSLIQDEGVALTRQQILNFEGAGVTCVNASGKTTCTITSGGGSYYQTVQDNGVAETQQPILNLTGAGVSCSNDGPNTRTTCTITGSGSSYYQTVQDEGSSLTQQPTLNFTGAGVTCVNDGPGTKTTCTITGGSIPTDAGFLYSGTTNPNGEATNFFPSTMVSNTSPSPYVASGSSIFAGLYDYYRPFDASGAGTYWLANATTGTLQIDLGTNSTIGATYSIQVNNVPEPNRAPKDWTVDGSADAVSWTTIDTVTGQTSWLSGETRTFTCDTATTAYRYYRIVVTANNGDASYLQISKWKMFNAATPLTTPAAGSYYIQTTNKTLYGPYDGVVTWPTIGTLN